jgi:hypothetical protein
LRLFSAEGRPAVQYAATVDAYPASVVDPLIHNPASSQVCVITGAAGDFGTIRRPRRG